MYEDTKGFKTAVVGGFNREDVLQYIEQAAKESSDKLEQLQAEAEQARDEAEKLRQDNVSLSQKNAELLERLGEMTVESDKLRQEAEQARAQAEQDAGEAQKLRDELQAAQNENSRLRTRMEALEQQNQEYLDSKDRLAEIELCAYRRAKEVDERAQQDAQRIRMQSAELISQVKHRLADVAGRYHAAQQRAAGEMADAGKRAEAVLGGINAVVETLDEVMVGELSSGQEDAPDRPTMSDAAALLKGEE